MGWTQPLCRGCWDKQHPDRVPVVLNTLDEEVCCMCGALQRDGIYVRVNPASVPYPSDV